MIIERGSFITGRKSAAVRTGLSERQVRTAQDTLVNLGMIRKSPTKSTNRFTHITICNYEYYQDLLKTNSHQSDQQATSKRPADDQQATTTNNVNNDNNDNNNNLPENNFRNYYSKDKKQTEKNNKDMKHCLYCKTLFKPKRKSHIFCKEQCSYHYDNENLEKKL
jgi:hypothetical protein